MTPKTHRSGLAVALWLLAIVLAEYLFLCRAIIDAGLT